MASKILKPETVNQLEKHLEHGRHIDTACKLVGISRQLFYISVNRWEIHGDENYKNFAQRMQAARSRFKTQCENKLYDLAFNENDSRSLQFILSKKFPMHWGSGSQNRRVIDSLLDQIFTIIDSNLDTHQKNTIIEQIEQLDFDDLFD